ncbi:hypothetical protein HYU13_05075 [Candidatus Woesearchaeota archaeon]|nr:hypothetical protein [Candidatus Woesearchaeota archaeon]
MGNVAGGIDTILAGAHNDVDNEQNTAIALFDSGTEKLGSFFGGKIKKPPPLTAAGDECYVDEITLEDAFFKIQYEDLLFVQGEHRVMGRWDNDKAVARFERYGGLVRGNYERGGVFFNDRELNPLEGKLAGSSHDDNIKFYSINFLATCKRARFRYKTYSYTVSTDTEGHIGKSADSGHSGIELMHAILWIKNLVAFGKYPQVKMEIAFTGSLTGGSLYGR